MKVLKNNYEADEVKDKKVESYPRICICEKCSSELEYEESDLRNGYLGLVYLDCPLCKHENALYDNEHAITLTADNIQFPTHFHRTSVETGAVNCCNNEYVKEYIQKAIEYFRNNKDEYSYGSHITGNLYINVHRWSGDEIYEINVSNDFYSSEIPFELEDY